jgi:hypothetical protein
MDMTCDARLRFRAFAPDVARIINVFIFRFIRCKRIERLLSHNTICMQQEGLIPATDGPIKNIYELIN